MIELNKKTQQDFLNREWVQRLLDAGVDMSDAKYCIVKYHNYDVVFYKNGIFTTNETVTNIIPTYTVSELLYKLHEWIYPTIDGVEYSGGLRMLKDAPFYIFYYNLKNSSAGVDDEYISAEFEYPIESLASLLIQCHKKDIGIARKDTGDISYK